MPIDTSTSNIATHIVRNNYIIQTTDRTSRDVKVLRLPTIRPNASHKDKEVCLLQKAEVEVETTAGEATATRKKKRRTTDRLELLMVGESKIMMIRWVGGKPHDRAFFCNTIFRGKFTFDATPTKLPGPDSQLIVSVYTRVPKGEGSDRGTLMVSLEEENGIGIETSVSPFDDYRFLYADTATTASASATSTTIEFPQTINGRIGAAKFVIGPNPFEMKRR